MKELRHRLPKLGRNDPCWCGSRKKFKNCHLGRSHEKPLHTGEIVNKIKRTFEFKECMHPLASKKNCDSVISAHTISKNKSISTIAENGHVYTYDNDVFNYLENREFKFKSIGVNKASTFRGFCGKHDNELFLPIESGIIELNNENACLLSYRVFCHELYDKESALECAYEAKNHVDKGLCFEEQLINQNIANGRINSMQLELKEFYVTKKIFDSIILSKNYNDFCWLGIRINGFLPILSAGGYIPEHDFKKSCLYELEGMELYGEYPGTIINILNDDVGAYIILGWIIDDERSAIFAEAFLNKINSYRENFLITFSMMSFRNIFCRPSWWNSLDDGMRKYLANTFEKSKIHRKNPNFFSAEKIVDFGFKGKIIKTIRNIKYSRK